MPRQNSIQEKKVTATISVAGNPPQIALFPSCSQGWLRSEM
jgi:hypothetical protein